VSALDPAYPLPSRVSDDAHARPSDRTPMSLLRDGLARRPLRRFAHLVRACCRRANSAAMLRSRDAPVGARIEWLLAQRRRCRGARNPPSLDNAMFALLARGPAAAALQALLRTRVSPAGRRWTCAYFLGACAAGDHAARGLRTLRARLLERGADPFAPSPAGDPPLALAVRLGWLRVVDACRTRASIWMHAIRHGMTALHLAAALGREAGLKSAGRARRLADMRAADGQTPLGVALSSGPSRPRRLARLARLAAAGTRAAGGDVPSAAIVGDADAVRRLLDLGFPSTPPMHRAAPRCCARPAVAIAPPSTCCSRAAPIRSAPRTPAPRRCRPR
jgi:hypothetical protein